MNNTSIGEGHIIEILQKEKIKFEREKTYKDLQHGLYRYDFFIPDLNILIEYDGEQHFKFVKKFYKKRSEFLKAQEHDRRKNSYALAHKISLYRIPYWELENIKTFQDLIQKRFLVNTKWWNDNLKNKANFR